MKRKDPSRLLDGLRKEQQEEVAYRMRMREVDTKARLEDEVAALKQRAKLLEAELEEARTIAGLARDLTAHPVPKMRIDALEKRHEVKEATACIVLSDLHLEETVDPREVDGRNKFDMHEASERMDRLALGFDWFLRKERSAYQIRKIWAPIAGDVVTNWLHGTEDSASNALGPFEGLLFARDRLVHFYDSLLAHDDIVSVEAPMVPGNHDRMPGTKKNPHRQRTALSIMLLLHDQLAAHYRNEPRIRFDLSFSSSHYTSIYGHDVRTTHGDGFTYNRGVGGIMVGARKFVDSLNASHHAAVTVFGHHHTHETSTDWVSNGSLIGWTAFSMNLGYRFQPAGQVAFVLDRDRGKRSTILLQVQETDEWA